jgi:hypothetical protein
MSDPKKDEADEDLLEFLGGIDEVNEDSKDTDEDFSDFLAKADGDPLAEPPKQPPPRDEKKHE